MSFTYVLHYPWIDIVNLGWLKNAILYWDHISTIVPASIAFPYETMDARSFQDEGVLTPLSVNSDMDEVKESSDQFKSRLFDDEKREIKRKFRESEFKVERGGYHSLLHTDKMSPELRDFFKDTKMAHGRGEWRLVNRNTATIYMTILAANLAKKRGLAMLADSSIFESTANSVYTESIPQTSSGRFTMETLGEAMLAYLSLQTVNITSDTPAEKIIKFRRKHRDELAHFRLTVSNLAAQLNEEHPSLESLQQNVHDIYINQIQPATNNLKRSLDGMKMKNFVDYLTTFAFGGSLSLIPASTLEPFLGSGSYAIALCAGGGFSVVAKVVKSRIDINNQFRADPYSFILTAQKEFGRCR
ncbi:MAG: hypothetical protein FOGNACKC_02934 [Anaerolineae bacterium]|nr:hypothetical protein [Anaerolineae bacterium]